MEKHAPGRARRGRRVFVLTAYLLWIGLLCWGGIKLFWWLRFGVSARATPGVDTVWQAFYPEIYTSGVLDADLSPTDGFYDVLLLGGSAMEQTGPEIRRALRNEIGDRFRLFVLARAAHSSRDSLLKVRRLGDRRFDLVVFYDAINDARMNCCPDDEFRDDYSHMSWYFGIERRLAAGRLTLTDVLLPAQSQGKTGRDATGAVYSARIKTRRAFESNVESIVAGAVERGSTVVLMSFASWIPPNYSAEAFHAGRLGYGAGPYKSEIGIWGTREGVAAAIDAHNKAVRAVAGRHRNVVFIDQRGLIPSDGRHFSDVCHFTTAGIEAFVSNLMRAVCGDIDRWKSNLSSQARHAVRPGALSASY